MKQRIFSIFTYISLSYTIILLCCAVTNLLSGGMDSSISNLFLLQVFLFPCVCWLLFELMNRISFFNRLPETAELVLRILIDYGLYLLFAGLLNWFSFTVPHLLLFTIVFLGVEAAVRTTFYLKMKQDEYQINRLLDNASKE